MRSRYRILEPHAPHFVTSTLVTWLPYLGVARGFQPLGQQAITALLARTETAAAKGEYEHYKFATYPS